MRTAWALAILAPLTFTACASTLPRKTSEDLRLCQSKSEDPKTGCPDGTLYVSNTNDQADFSSVQDAILSLPQDASPRIILIGSGTYEEQLNVTRPGPLTLLGELEEEPEQPYADVEDEPTARPNEVTILWKAANSGGSYPDNVYTSCLVVAPTLNASFTGSGPTGWPVPEGTPFGCSDFRAYNIDFRNQYSKQADGPSHAFTVAYANAGFYSCGFYSYQDTIFVGKLGNVLLHDSIIAGQTDFIYGFGTYFIAESTLLLRGCGGGITAMKGTNTTFENKYGAYISDSKVLAANETVAEQYKDRCSLGRPWNELHRSLFAKTYFDESILPAGYTWWGGKPPLNNGDNTTMAVYRNYGPGNDVEAQRESGVTRVWGCKDAKGYLSPRDVFMTPEGEQPNVEWIDSSRVNVS